MRHERGHVGGFSTRVARRSAPIPPSKWLTLKGEMSERLNSTLGKRSGPATLIHSEWRQSIREQRLKPPKRFPQCASVNFMPFELSSRPITVHHNLSKRTWRRRLGARRGTSDHAWALLLFGGRRAECRQLFTAAATRNAVAS
jgi:hypothetical protein